MTTNDEYEKVWVCRNCLRRFTPTRNKYSCTKCGSQNTYPTKEDSLLKKSETHRYIPSTEHIDIVSESALVKDSKIEYVYDRCVSWLNEIKARITTEEKPNYLAGSYLDKPIAIKDMDMNLRFRLEQIGDNVKIWVRMIKLREPALVGPLSSEVRTHIMVLQSIEIYRKHWRGIFQNLLEYLGVESHSF
jgi:hypothetical protein